MSDLRGCHRCNRSVRADVSNCPHCGAELIATFELESWVESPDGTIRNLKKSTLKAPVLTEPAEDDEWFLRLLE